MVDIKNKNKKINTRPDVLILVICDLGSSLYNLASLSLSMFTIGHCKVYGFLISISFKIIKTIRKPFRIIFVSISLL